MAGELLPGGVIVPVDAPDFSRLQSLRSAILSLVDADFVPPTSVEESYAQRLEADLDTTEAELRRTTDLPSVQWTYMGCVLGSLTRSELYAEATQAIATDWYHRKTA